MNVIVNIDGEQKGFFLGILVLLKRSNHNVICIVPGLIGKKNIEDKLKSVNIHIDTFVVSRSRNTTPVKNLIEESLKREKKYNITFNALLAQDRGLGKGYLCNIKNFPDQRVTWWDYKKKLTVILNGFIEYEKILLKFNPDIIIGAVYQDPILASIAKYLDIGYYTVQSVRYGKYRFIWADDKFQRNDQFINSVEKYLSKKPTSVKIPEYEMELLASINIKANLSFRFAVIRLFKIIKNDTKGIIRNKIFRKGYVHYGYKSYSGLLPVITKPIHYRYCCKHGVKPSDLTGYKIVYYPLNREPEISLIGLSPKMSNAVEILNWISKSIPCDTIIVVKEQPVCYGHRSLEFYKRLRKISNIRLAYPDIHSWEWIKKCSIVATITGTVGNEAVFFNKPVLSFGEHQIVNKLPTVFYANSFHSTRESLKKIFNSINDEGMFTKAKEVLYKAIMEVSFEFSEYSKSFKNTEIRIDMAEYALKKLEKKLEISILKKHIP